MIGKFIVVICLFSCWANAEENNILLNKVILSSVGSRGNLLIDGNYKTCIWTNPIKHGYIVIDLKDHYSVESFKITRKYYWIKLNYTFYLSDKFEFCYFDYYKKLASKCTVVTDNSRNINTSCDNGPLTGRYIIIGFEENNHFDFCEIEAFGKMKKKGDRHIFKFADKAIEPITYKNFDITTSLISDGDKVKIPNYSSGILYYEDNCQPLIWKEGKPLFAVACKKGKGRMVAFGKNSFFHSMTSNENKALYDKLLKWLTKGSSSEPKVIVPKSIDSLNTELKSKDNNKKYIIISLGLLGNNDIDLIDKVIDLFNSGKIGLALNYHDWHGNPTPLTRQKLERLFSIQYIYGFVTWRKHEVVIQNYKGLTDKFETIKGRAEKLYKSHSYLLKNFKRDLPILSKAPQFLLNNKDIKNLLLKVLKKYESFLKHHAICEKSPATDATNRTIIEAVGEIGLSPYLVDSDYKMPHVNLFPGDFKKTPKKSSYTIKLKSITQRTKNPIGLYLQAGDTLSYEIISKTGKVWYIAVGCHSDYLPYSRSGWTRYPHIYVEKMLDGKSGKIYSAYGGVLWLRNDEVNTEIEIKISNVVRSPFYNARNKNMPSKWDSEEKNQPGLWAQIAGDNMVLCESTDLVKQYSGKYLDNLMKNYWDKIVRADFGLKGVNWKERRPEMTVLDMMISIGYGHSGYPIEVFLEWNKGIFDTSYIDTKGSWGMCHEIGHNMQEGRWTFSGTGEVTNNLLCLFNYEKVLKLPYKYSTNETTDHKKLIKYFANGASFDAWTSDPWLALHVYAQLANHMGWGFYGKVFRYYSKQNINPKTNSDKIKQWMNITSIVSNQNLLPIFDFWGFPMSEDLSEQLSKMPCFFPDDFMVQDGLDRSKSIRNKYSNCHTKSTFNEDFDVNPYFEGIREDTFTLS